MPQDKYILGIETSCDETAAAVMKNGELIFDCTTTQLLHSRYGGVVPELASRAHEKLLASGVEQVLNESNINVDDLNAVAVTHGPGLAGALLVGVSFAKGLCFALDIPLIGVNHIEAHLWSGQLTGDNPEPPFLALILSGGHTILVEVEGFGEYEILGSTKDDAVGELFDKVGRMMGFQFPSGAELDRRALLQDSRDEVRFPRAVVKENPLAFSFSGLKTAVLYHLNQNFKSTDGHFEIGETEKNSILRGLMNAVSDMLCNALLKAARGKEYNCIVVGGGVSASKFLRTRFKETGELLSIPVIIPPFRYCTDNGAMIAHLGCKLFEKDMISLMNLQIDPGLRLGQR